jgi:predicted DCC family thiol-disulfide oxidoreductase YuxK
MTARVIYDGDCPFCSEYVRLVRFRENVGQVELVNAREHPALTHEYAAQGYDLDQGMLLELDGQRYFGADCIERMALLSTDFGTFNRLNKFVFRHKALARVLYPVLRAGRNAYLRLTGVPPLG